MSATTEAQSLSELYERDETAWLDIMSGLAAQGRVAEMDLVNLSEFLESMARRDRRELTSRLVVLLTHLLKWNHQPENRSGSWHATISEQRRQLGEEFESGTLRRHAAEVLMKAYGHARKHAADETGLALDTFPAECPWKIDDLVAEDDLTEAGKST